MYSVIFNNSSPMLTLEKSLSNFAGRDDSFWGIRMTMALSMCRGPISFSSVRLLCRGVDGLVCVDAR